MDFYREESVKIYRADSATARVWGFFATALMHELVRKADRAGVLYLPEGIEDLYVATASALECPDVSWISEHLPKLIEHGAVVYKNHALVIERYHEAQYSGIEANLSAFASKRKKKDTQVAVEKGLIAVPFWWKISVPIRETGT